ncbi:MAG: low temperature requirement protein A [Burkholderiaceae bacterium]|jgi:low temperature requirement protein LtrA
MTPHRNFLRTRDEDGPRVTNEELFFDLIYAFAVTQLSHRLLENLTLVNVFQTLVLWFAVWLGWQYTCWVTNWCNPRILAMRFMLFIIMGIGLFVAAAIPDAYGERGLMFAAGYVTIQVGRTLFVLYLLGPKHALAPNFQRILGWLCISAVLWLSGSQADGAIRLGLWALAVLCEYVSPMFGFWLPGLGRSKTTDWTIDGGHIAERCQLFVMMALGESVLVTGASLSQAHWSVPTLIATAVALLISISLWWIYFDSGSSDGAAKIERSGDPGRMGACFHYVHVTLIGGIIVVAVANELIIAEPATRIRIPTITVLVLGPLLYLLGNGLYKKMVYSRTPVSHIAGGIALLILIPLGFQTDRLMIGGLLALILVAVAALEGHRIPREDRPPPST